MKAVIFAAGEGTRMRPLTLETPKPMLKVLDKPLIQYTFESLPDAVTEVVVIVGYKEEQIKAFLGDSFMNRSITYVHQDVLNGTGGALLLAKPYLTDKFIVTMADDMYAKVDIEKCLAHDCAMLVYRAQNGQKVGAVSVEAGKVVGVVEGGAEQMEHPLINTGVYVLTPDIFDHPMVTKSPGSSELGLPQSMIAAYPHAIQAVEATFWLSLTEPKDLERAEEILSTV